MSLERAFHAICEEAQEHRASGYYVSLYEEQSFYGGPEEGGWEGQDTVLIASQRYNTEQGAEAARDLIRQKVKEWDAEARREHGQRCLEELDYCERRMIDDSNSVFGEVASPTRHRVFIETQEGEHAHRGDRYYS